MRSYYDENERGIIYLFDLFEYIDKKMQICVLYNIIQISLFSLKTCLIII